MPRPNRVTDQARRAAASAHLVRLEAVKKPTAGQQALRRRLRDSLDTGDDARRRQRRALIDRLEDIEEPTRGEQAFLDRLRQIDEHDPQALISDDEARRLLGLQ